MNQTIRTMNQHEFLTYIESVHAKLTDIATENGFAILLAATISDQKNGTTTAWSTNMTEPDTFRALAQQSTYFFLKE